MSMVIPCLIDIDGTPLNRDKHERTCRYRCRFDRKEIYVIRSCFVPLVVLAAGVLAGQVVDGDLIERDCASREKLLSRLRFEVLDQTGYVYRYWPVVESLWREKRLRGHYQLVVKDSTKIRLDGRLRQFDDERVRAAMGRLQGVKV